MIKRWRKVLHNRYQQWIFRRLPPVKKIKLDNRKLFIFPTRSGFVFLGLLLLLWLMATNYENNLVFAFTCLLTSLFIVGVFHTFWNLSGLTIEGGKTAPGFAGQAAEFEYLLSQTGKQSRSNIEFSCPGVETVCVSLTSTEIKAIYLSVSVKQRGWFQAPRITVKSVYPLGLLKVWTSLQIDMTALVYPRPLEAPLPSLLAAKQDDKTPPPSYTTHNRGSEDFVGLEKYRLGESRHHIAWKQYAREQGLLTKHYADGLDDELWLDWQALIGMNTEARLSRLCAWTVHLSEKGQPYGLRLPGIELSLGTGRAHRDGVLRELALFELEKEVGGA